MIGVDLRTANLGSGYPATSFFQTDLRNANLQGVVSTASFWQVDLSGATLQNGLFEYVRYATMTGANLTNASFVRMDLLDSFTWGATTCADGSNSDNHAGTCVGYMSLQQTNTPSLTLTRSKTFTPSRTPTLTTSLTPSTTSTPVASSDCSVRAQNSNLAGCNLQGVDFAGLNLNGTDFRNANLTDANFTGALLWRTNWGGATLTRTNFTRAEIVDATMMGVDLRTAVLGSTYPATGFARTNMRYANLQGVVSTASFWSVDLTGANLQDGIFDNLRYIDMSGANLTNATFKYMGYLDSFTWSATTCADGSTSDVHGGTCVGYMMMVQTYTPSHTVSPTITNTPTATSTATNTSTRSMTNTDADSYQYCHQHTNTDARDK
jgi:uncharacterized protein YjbI with pentapeptide repeats